MKTIKELIEQSKELSTKLTAETPGLHSLTFVFEGFPVEEVKEAGDHYGSEVELSDYYKAYHFCTSIGSSFIHIRSVKVKVRVVLESVEDVNTPMINA